VEWKAGSGLSSADAGAGESRQLAGRRRQECPQDQDGWVRVCLASVWYLSSVHVVNERYPMFMGIDTK
jgi:hypothetical protein